MVKDKIKKASTVFVKLVEIFTFKLQEYQDTVPVTSETK